MHYCNLLWCYNNVKFIVNVCTVFSDSVDKIGTLLPRERQSKKIIYFILFHTLIFHTLRSASVYATVSFKKSMNTNKSFEIHTFTPNHIYLNNAISLWIWLRKINRKIPIICCYAKIYQEKAGKFLNEFSLF